jgi:hypothetical protein
MPNQNEYTLPIKQHKSHAKLQTKIAKKYRQKRRTVYRSEQEPTWQVPLWTLVKVFLYSYILILIWIIVNSSLYFLPFIFCVLYLFVFNKVRIRAH